MAAAQVNRPLTAAEHRLARWMLENGTREALAFLPQVELAEVTPWQCHCGCASINFQIRGQPEAPPGVHILGYFLVGEGDRLSGAFIFESGGLLSGLEVYGLGGDAPTVLPRVEDLRPFERIREWCMSGLPNPSLHPTRYGWLRQPPRAAELKR